MKQKYKPKLDFNIDHYLEYKLRTWAKWYIKLLTGNLDFNSRSIEAILMDDGGILSRSTAPGEAPLHSEAEHTDACINELARYNTAYAKAIRMRYTSTKPADEQAKIWNEKRPQEFYEKVKFAKMWLIGRISNG